MQRSDISFRSLSKRDRLIWESEFTELKHYYEDICKSWHEKRQNEFLMGRYLVHKTLKEKDYTFWSTPVDIGKNREPLFNPQISASLTHNESLVVFAMTGKKSCLGIDIESKGRIKKSLEKQILRSEDVSLLKEFGSVDGQSYDDALTLIFSAKEACYKALFPYVQEYFGFQDAYVKEINLESKRFSIEVTKVFGRLNNQYSQEMPLIMRGAYLEDKFNIFSYIDVIQEGVRKLTP